MSYVTPLSCSECGVHAYVRCNTAYSDVICSECGNEVSWQDFQLDYGEVLVWDDDGYLCVNFDQAAAEELEYERRDLDRD